VSLGECSDQLSIYLYLLCVAGTGLFLHPKVSVSNTGLPSQVLDAECQVIPESSTLGIDAIQRPHNEVSLPSVFTKFRTKHCPNFICHWGSQISFINVSYHDI
jgi:hypothetical protein